jgi:hypothetical protein
MSDVAAPIAGDSRECLLSDTVLTAIDVDAGELDEVDVDIGNQSGWADKSA